MIQHDSDCAVHNDPALPPGPCDCGAQAKYERRWLAYLYQRGCTHLTRRRIAFGTWLGRRFCQARTDATRALCLTCYRLLFGKRAARDALRWWCRALTFRIMDCRDTRGHDVTLTDNQKRAMIKRVADALEKLGVAGLAVGIFQGNVVGAVCGIAFIGVSLALTYYLER